MNNKRTVLMNAAVIGVVLLLALLMFLLRPALPDRDITPNAGTLEDAGFTFTFESSAPAGSQD
ncbi:MAG: hypothetical protein IJ343_08680 [Clostridia bacterium]|nr:hypothetical protein [Clostridia bacterium]